MKQPACFVPLRLFVVVAAVLSACDSHQTGDAPAASSANASTGHQGDKSPTSTPLPETFGLYAVDQQRLQPLSASRIVRKGNLNESVAGFSSPRLPQLSASRVQQFVLYDATRGVERLTLHSLRYQFGTSLSTMFGSSYYATGLWVADKEIPLEKGLLDDKRKIGFARVAQAPLPVGRYALHFGQLSTTSTLDGIEGPGGAFGFQIVPDNQCAIELMMCAPPGASPSELQLTLTPAGDKPAVSVPITPVPGKSAEFFVVNTHYAEAFVPLGQYERVAVSLGNRTFAISSHWDSCASKCDSLNEDCFTMCNDHRSDPLDLSSGGEHVATPLTVCDFITPCTDATAPGDLALVAQLFDTEAGVREAAEEEVRERSINLADGCRREH